jgi:amino acid transporter
MAVGQEKLYEVSDDTGSQPQSMYGSYDDAAPKQSLVQRFVDSFKPEPNARPARVINEDSGAKVYDVEAAVAATAQSPLARKLKGRHLQMIAIGGSIGKPTPPISCLDQQLN